MQLTPKEKALLDDLLLDGEDFCGLVITDEELPIAIGLEAKKLIILDKNLSGGRYTASAYKNPLQKCLSYVDSLEIDLDTRELFDDQKAQVLEYVKLKFGL